MKKYLAMFLAVLMLASMMPMLVLAEETGEADPQARPGDQETFDEATFTHIDVRIAGASFTLKRNIVDKDGNIISTSTETITANVTKVYSVTINGTKYEGFSKSGSYEFRKTKNVSIKGKDITDSSRAVIVVDLQDSKGNTYEKVSISMGKSQIVKAAENCDGYRPGHYDGLDFQLEGEVSGQDIEVSVSSTGIGFEITKNLDGVPCTTPNLFEFELYQGDKLIASAKNDANGKAVIAISYENLTDFSDITYLLREKVGGDGYIYDLNEYTIVVGFHEPELDEHGDYVRKPYVKSGEISNLVFNNTTVTPSPAPTEVPTPSPAPTEEPTPSPAPTEEPTPSPAPTEEPTPSPAPTEEPTPSPAPTEEPTPSPAPTEEPTPSPAPTEEPTPSPAPTEEPTPSPAPTEEPTPSPAPTEEPTPSPAPTEEPTPSPAPTEEPTPSPAPTEVPNPQVDLMIPVKKIVEKTGSYLPNTDTTFNFSVKLSNKECGTDKIVVKWGDAPIADGKFSLTVKAGETGASGYLYISGPLSQIANLSGTIEEIVPENTGKWTYDTKVYSFTTDAEGGFASFYYTLDGSTHSASAAEFTNQFKEDVPRTTLTVKKVWQDKGYEKKRPGSVTVELYYYQKDKNGKDTKTKVLYKVNGKSITAELNENNDWSYTFENLDARWTWTVDEVKTPSGYSRKVTLSADKKTATVTNTYGAQPKTGFDGLPLILCMAGVMLAGGAALVLINKKKSSRKSR